MAKAARHLVLLASAWLGTALAIHAQEPVVPPPPLVEDSVYASPLFTTDAEGYDALPLGIWNFQFMTGAYFSPVAEIGPEQPTYNFVVQSFRLGRTTQIGFANGILRGSLEPVMELNLGESTSDLGNFFIGPSWMLRYNFVQPDRRLVPYYQLGAGFQYNDAYKDQSQQSLGQSVQFLLQAQVGARWFMSERATLGVEGGYMHISNADMADRNGGINAFGFTVGFSYFFGQPYRPSRY